jgi:Holliday junction resolvase RusA-like endonuclease
LIRRFDIPPVAASRPRVGKWGAYYSGPYKDFREQAKEKIQDILGSEFKPLLGPLAVVIEVYVTRPKTTKLDYPKPDIDNYTKAVLDVLNGIMWEDDSQIISVYATKQWAEENEEGYFTIEVNNDKL